MSTGVRRLSGTGPAGSAPVGVAVTAATMRFLAWHEARAHAVGGRLVRDLGDAILLHDPRDRDPFWNRLSGVRLPDDAAAFDARLAELVVLFGGLDRRPHLWVTAASDEPSDLGARLSAHGFDDLGGGLTMILGGADQPSRSPEPAAPEGVSIEIHGAVAGRERHVLADEVAALLVAAFRVDPFARPRLSADLAAALDGREMRLYVARVGGTVAAVAKRTSVEGASYLSSIATRPGWEGRGLGTAVTVAACSDARADGDRIVHLRVFPENVRARAIYERLGFSVVGDRAADYLLAWA